MGGEIMFCFGLLLFFQRQKINAPKNSKVAARDGANGEFVVCGPCFLSVCRDL